MRLLVTREVRYTVEGRILIELIKVDLIISHEMGHAWGANHDEDYGRDVSDRMDTVVYLIY